MWLLAVQGLFDGPGSSRVVPSRVAHARDQEIAHHMALAIQRDEEEAEALILLF